MRYIKKGTKVVIYGPDNMSVPGYMTYTEQDFIITEEFIESYLKEMHFYGAQDNISKYLDYKTCIRLVFDMNYKLKPFKKSEFLVASDVYYMWVNIESLITV